MYKQQNPVKHRAFLFLLKPFFPPTDLAFQVWELHRGITRVNRHSVWIPACGEANSLHYSLRLATMFLPSSGKSPERLLNPPLCIQRPELCCTCQSGQTELGVPHLHSLDIWYSDWKYSEFSNFHRSVGSRRLAIPRPARAQTLLCSGGPAVARSVSSAPLNWPVCFMILPLTSAISDQPLTPRLMLLQLSRIQPWEYSGREAGSKGGVLFCLWCPAFKLNTNRQAGNVFWMEVYERLSTSIQTVCFHRYLALLLFIFLAAIISFFNSLLLYRTVDFPFYIISFIAGYL